MNEFTRSLQGLNGLSADAITLPAGVSPANPYAGTASTPPSLVIGGKDSGDAAFLSLSSGISTGTKIALVIGALAVMAGYFFFIKRK